MAFGTLARFAQDKPVANIAIITGTVYGGAQLVADEIQSALENLDHTVSVWEEPSVNDLEEDTLDLLLVCTSTTGAGELPDDIAPFYTALVDTPPRITTLKYAVIALGDSSYGDTYCGAGLSVDNALQEAGAIQVEAPLQLDAMETVTPEDDAVPWAMELVDRHL